LEKYYTVVMAHSGFWRGTILNRRNFNNVPVTHVADVLEWGDGSNPSTDMRSRG
jgi:hypothetical protein